MNQIYTKTGDHGQTSLRGGVRVPKTDPRIEANGQIDHLNACLGIVRAMLTAHEAACSLILQVQEQLMVVMSHIATPAGQTNPRPLQCAALTAQLEQAIDAMPHKGGFVVPGGGSALAAFIHLARTQARTVERCLWALDATHRLPGDILVMVNRLSDYLFTLANHNE